jgi:hypothetical protein
VRVQLTRDETVQLKHENCYLPVKLFDCILLCYVYISELVVTRVMCSAGNFLLSVFFTKIQFYFYLNINESD